MTSTVGTRFAACPTSLGRALLAFLSKDALEDYFRKVRLTGARRKNGDVQSDTADDSDQGKG